MALTDTILFQSIDFRCRIVTNHLNLTAYSQSTLPTETRNEGKYNHHRELSFFLKISLNFERILTEYAAPINKDYLNGCWFAPEDLIVVVLPTFSPYASVFILHLAQHHLGRIVGFDVAKGDESADPASLLTLAPHGIDMLYSSSYLSQQDPNLTLPHGQTLQLPLAQSCSFARNSFPHPTYLSDIHPDFVLPLSSFKTFREYSVDPISTLLALVKPLFENHRNWERKEEKCTPSAAEQREHGIYGQPQTSSGNTLNA